jgi:hypothetical protein
MIAWWEWAIYAAVVVLVLLPPRWDPAIRLKEWIDKKGGAR